VDAIRLFSRCAALVLIAAAASYAQAGVQAGTLAVPAHGVIGVEAQQLDPGFWIARAADPDRVIFDAQTIASRNAALFRLDSSLHDLQALPSTLQRADVVGWIQALSARPAQALHDIDGKTIADKTLDALVDNLALSAVPETQRTRYGLIVHRADLRTFPTNLAVFTDRSDTFVDRFQETALFPGMPVVIAHESRDGLWWFVVSERYAAWVEKKHIAEAAAAQVFAYAHKKPYRVVTGAYATTTAVPDQPGLSRVRIDMGARVPALADWSPAQPVNGQHPYASYVVELPQRDADGSLKLKPALLQKSEDSQPDYLPLTRANILRQAFKFLGERYGWGHGNDARDCSGFVSDVYRSMGVEMPRNTRDQSISPALTHRVFGAADDHATRLAAARALEVGDLVYIPGHVMMAIGSIDGEPYVIHDTSGLSYRRGDGSKARVELNEVSVSPLLPLLFNDTQTYIDRMTSIVRIRPDTAREAPAKP
jgi:cell wall-associated NlpC family hydrolase